MGPEAHTEAREVILEHAAETFEKIREVLALDRHTVTFSQEEIPDARAFCVAQPEYREGRIVFDMDKLHTGDDFDEIIVHEATHFHTWELHGLCEELANALADSLPETHREGMRKMLLEKVRQAGERATTDVGQTYLRLLRRAKVLDTPVPTA